MIRSTCRDASSNRVRCTTLTRITCNDTESDQAGVLWSSDSTKMLALCRRFDVEAGEL